MALFATAPGQTMLVSQLNAPLAIELGLRPLAINAAYTVGTIAAALPLVLVGAMTDRVGPRRALVFVAIAFALACAAMAGAHGIVTVTLGFFLLRFLGQGALALAAQHAVAMWFHRRLGSIQGIKLVVLFGAWVPLPPLTAWMIVSLGWRSTWLIFGLAVAVLVIPLALRFVRNRPEELGLRMDNDPRPAAALETEFGEELPEATGAGPHSGIPASRRVEEALRVGHDWTLSEARRTAAFWILAASFFVSPLVGTAMLFDMGPILAAATAASVESIGDVAGDVAGGWAVAAATPISVWSAAMAIMALPAGFLTDRFRARVLVGVGMLLMTSSPAVLWAWTNPLGASVAMCVFAVGQSLVAASGSAAVARYFGRSHHGAIRGSMARIGVIGAGLGPLVTGVSVHVTGGYALGLLAMAAMGIPVAIAAIWLVAPEHDRVSDGAS